MTALDLFVTIMIMVCLFTLRFGIPILVMWLGKIINTRFLHLQP